MRGTIVGALALIAGGCAIAHPSAPPPSDSPPTTPVPSRPPGTTPTPDPGLPPGTDALPPLSGGTMTLTADGRAVVVDPQAGLLALVNLGTMAIDAQRPLDRMDEPGRVIVDPAGRLHVVLRRAGELLTLSPALEELSRRAICEAPRGLVHDPATDQVHVACASGELVSFPASGGQATRSVEVDSDLRDVVISGGTLFVSRFHSAELLTLDAAGTVLGRRSPSVREATVGRERTTAQMEPNVAYRIRAVPDGVLMVHQRSMSTAIVVEESGYGGGDCRTGVVESAITVFPLSGEPQSSGALTMIVLPLDAALSADGTEVFVASGANMFGGISLSREPRSVALSATIDGAPCAFASASMGSADERFGSTVAVEALADGRMLIQRSGTSTLLEVWRDGINEASVAHPSPVGSPRGFTVFHSATPSMVACASCHPEAGEDGHTWDFQPVGLRRTQTLLGGLLGTAPFHWSGDQPSMEHIMTATFAERMGARLAAEDSAAVAAWLDAQPVDEGPMHDVDASSRGATVFAEACASCHAGETLTDNRTLDVGTGGAFQVPSLRGVAYRAPFLHDGCAETLAETLDGTCAPHGNLAGRSAAERADVLTYLRSL